MTWLKYLGAALAAAALFVSGYRYAAALYETDITELQTQHALALKEKTGEHRSKEQSQAKQLADAWDALSALALSLSVCVVTLTGCASSPTIIAPSCPEPAPIPAALSESDSQDAQNFSKKVQDYLQKEQNWLKE